MILLLSSCIGSETVEDSSGLVYITVEKCLVLKPGSNPKCRSEVQPIAWPQPRDKKWNDSGPGEKRKAVRTKKRSKAVLIQ